MTMLDKDHRDEDDEEVEGENDKQASQYVTIKKISKGHTNAIVGISYIEDAINSKRYLITCAHNSLKVWQITGGDSFALIERNEVKGWRSGVQDFDISRDGRLAAVVGVDSVLHQIVISLEEHKHTLESFNFGLMEAWHVKIVPDQVHYLTVSFSGSLKIIDITGKVAQSVPFNTVKQISALAYSPDGKMLAVVNNEGVVTIMNASDLQTRFFFEAHALKVRSICFSLASDSLLTGSDDKIVKLFRIQDAEAQFVRSFCGHRNCVTAVKFHPRDVKICSNDGSVIVWDEAQDRPMHIFENAHDGVARNLTFSTKGNFIISVGEDRAICIHRISIEQNDDKVPGGTQHMDFNIDAIAQYAPTAYDELEDSHSLMSNFNGYGKELDDEDELLVRAQRDIEGLGSDQ